MPAQAPVRGRRQIARGQTGDSRGAIQNFRTNPKLAE